MNWRISSELHQALLEHAVRTPDQEVCGLLFGKPGVVANAAEAGNVANDPASSFEIDPAALIEAHRQARTGGPKLIGCYHSHPNGCATPSKQDQNAAAGTGWLWLIIGNGQVSAWQDQAGHGLTSVQLSRV